jgi:hypothetical protein
LLFRDLRDGPVPKGHGIGRNGNPLPAVLGAPGDSLVLPDRFENSAARSA